MSDGHDTPAHIKQFWAKSEPRYGWPRRVHLLEHHLADVGAVFEQLLEQPTIRQRLACSGKLEDIDDVTAARLSLLAALHDIGKVNLGFQDHRAGHYNELTPLINGSDKSTGEAFFNAIDWWHQATESWDDSGGETLCSLLIASLSHHGKPLQLEGNKPKNTALWDPVPGLDPMQKVRYIAALARQWFPRAFDPAIHPLPSKPAFQHMFLGLCILADWIGSNDKDGWFPFCDQPNDDYMDAVARTQGRKAMLNVALDLTKQRKAIASTGERTFSELFGFAPNAIQTAARDTPLNEPLVIIESETGSGKTEAALWRFARMYCDGLVDGLYFALPTRSAAVQLHGRVKAFAANFFPEGHAPKVVLAVPGYGPDVDADAMALHEYDSHAAGHGDEERHDKPWASEGPKRYLAAQIAIGTVDQAMMGTLKVKHAHLRAACLARNLLVVDEVHASDAYMSRILKELLDAHLGTGGYALLMSATLGSVARTQWLADRRWNIHDTPPLKDAKNVPYPAITNKSAGNAPQDAGENDRPKSVAMTAEPLMRNHSAVAERAFQAAREGAKVLVVRNTVTYAIATHQALEEIAADADRGLLFSCERTLTVHHGRFAPGDRRLLDRELEGRLGKGSPSEGIVVVGTQTLEQSLDIDADLLITDLCPVDVLLQRIGRLHRHPKDRPAGYADPKCIVLTPDDDLSPLLKNGPDRNGLGPHGYVYEDLRVLEATSRLVRKYETWEIPVMNRELVEEATHPDPLKAIEEALGEEWAAHGRKILGGEIADGLTASEALIRRNKSFFVDNDAVLFPSGASGVEERIRTRLGDDRLDVEFDPPPPSPFQAERAIEKLAVPSRWLGGADIEGPLKPALDESGFTFRIGDRSFEYGRLGLRQKGTVPS